MTWPGAAWRLLRIGGLIASGLLEVRRRLPQLDNAARDRLVQRWAQAVLRVLRVEVLTIGEAHVAEPANTKGARGQLLVANHISWLDVIVLLSLCPQARFVAKADVRQWPLVGALVAGAGTLFVDRTKRRAVVQALADMTQLLQGGAVVAVFPEGTTSDGREVLAFRASLLQAATQARSPVQPAALRYADREHAISPHVPYIGADSFGVSLWRLCAVQGVVATVRWLPVHETATLDRHALADALSASIAAALRASAHGDSRGSA